jgi:hypothetical protein
MPLIASFIVGALIAQLGWWLAASGATAADASSAAAPTFQFLMVAGIQILVAGAAFGIALSVAAKSQPVPSTVKSCLVAAFSGAVTLTFAGIPYSLVPRMMEGEAQLVILIVVAAVASACLGALVGAAFRKTG